MGKYSEKVMDHFLSPRNCGHMAGADRIGLIGIPGSGPFMLFYLRLDGGRVADAMFQTYGCGTTIAAGSMLTELVKNRSIEDCQGITEEQLVQALDGVPYDKLH